MGGGTEDGWEHKKRKKKTRKRRECPSGKSRSDWKNGGTTLTEINLYNLFLKMHTHRHSNTYYVSLGGSFYFWVTLPCLGDTHFTLSLDAWCPIKSYSEAVSKMLLGGKKHLSDDRRRKKPQLLHSTENRWAGWENAPGGCFCEDSQTQPHYRL